MRLPLMFIAAALTLMVAPAGAQSQGPVPRGRPLLHRPLRIEVSPPPRLARHCIGGYALEHRASGDTIVPRMRCWWAPV
jgi:hypothetical protein